MMASSGEGRYPPRVRTLSVLSALIALLVGCTDEIRVAHPPTAFAGFDRSVVVGDEVVLDASLSSDPDGDRLAFSWRLVDRPDGSTATLDRAVGPIVRFVPDVVGSYVASLSAADMDYEARDLVGIHALDASSSSTAPSIAIAPSVCQGDLGRLDLADCGIGPDRVEIFSDVSSGTVTWRYLRLPAGLVPEDLDADEGDALEFTPPRPGDYWIAATRRVGDLVSPPSLAAIGVFDGDATERPVPIIDAPARVDLGSVILFDARASIVPTSTTVVRTWRLEADPSGEQDPLTDRATGCPPNQCQRLIPSATGTYIVSHAIEVDGRNGVTAVWAVEVE